MLLTGLRHIAQPADELGDKYDKTFFSSRRLVVFDDIFPHPLSAFRFAEFTTYLEAFRFSEVHSTGAALPFMHEIRTLSQLIRDFGREYPGFRRRVFQYEPIGPSPPSLFYCVFLNNAATIV